MTIKVQIDLVREIIKVCENFLPEDVEVDIFYSDVETDEGEQASCALMMDEEDKVFSIVINDDNKYNEIPELIASQTSCILSYLAGDGASRDTPTWKESMLKIKEQWDERLEMINEFGEAGFVMN